MRYTQDKLSSFTRLDLSDGSKLSTDSFGLNTQGWSFKTQKPLLLNRFSEHDMFSIMQKTGMIEALNRHGFDDLNAFIDKDDANVYYLKLYSGAPDPGNMLMDLRVTETRFMPKAHFFPDDSFLPAYDMVVIEWLSLQNTHSENFSSDRPQLPGQTRPGLGILNYCFAMMYDVARQVSKDGFLDIPEHLHGAIMYSKKFMFFDPANEALLRAVLRDLRGYSMSDLSWGIITKTIVNEVTGEPEIYTPSEQIYYASERMKGYFESHMYKSTFKKLYRKKKYRFDYKKMVQMRAEILKTKNISDV